MQVDMNVAQGFMKEVQKMGQMKLPSKRSDQERVDTAKRVMLEGIDSQLASRSTASWP